MDATDLQQICISSRFVERGFRRTSSQPSVLIMLWAPFAIQSIIHNLEKSGDR